ncbi:MAG: ATP-dependent helicase HrpB [Candidatus Thiodiazotropha sp. DIVDIV]
MSELPVKQVIPDLSRALESHRRAVLSAPPGSGKTTLVPLELLDTPWLDGAGILLLEPRRLAARAAASRMASLLNESVGERVGYTIRLERKISRNTRIEVVTEGILTRRLQQNPELPGVGLVIFDEFHERNLHSDLSLALALDAQQGLRDDLHLLVMSATLDQQRISALMDDAPIVQAEGRQFPVTNRYLGQIPEKRKIAEQVAGAIVRAYQSEAGDVLAFLPGVAEIRGVEKLLASRFSADDIKPLITPLYGDLPKAAQDRAILPDLKKRRRIVLTTSIAETSLTIEGIEVVVDCGWTRMPRFLPGMGLTRLETVPVSQAAAVQRAGRAGRLGPGVCYRLCAESYHDQLQAHHPAEILQTDLAPLALQLASWGVADPTQLRWLDPPPRGAFSQAVDLLQTLGALDQQGRLTTLGKRMAELPTHPRLAHMLVHTPSKKRQLVSDIVSLLSERDIINSREDGCDLGLRLRLLNAWRENRAPANVAASSCRHIDRISKDWLRRLQRKDRLEKSQLSVGQLLALAFPDRLAQRSGHARFRLVNGRAVRLAEHDPLANEPFLVAAQLDAGRSEGRVRLAASIDLEEIRSLPEARINEVEEVVWDKRLLRVNASLEERLGALVLSRKTLPPGESEIIKAAMIEGIQFMGLDALPWTPLIRQWQDRVIWLGAHTDDSIWPDLSDDWLIEHLEVWLGPWLDSVQSKGQLQRLDLFTILQTRLTWEQQQSLNQWAPTHLKVPSGSKIALQYSKNSVPVLAVRLQEMFGLTETPKVGQKPLAVMLHLLSPAQRPIQITDDLAGFWLRTYSDVKKELKGRYPKHYWPDDPLQAQATNRVKPRKSR